MLLVALAVLAILLSPSSANTPIVSDDFNQGEDHRAHAVPGGPYVVYDHSGNGLATVSMDGSRSHSHYFNPVHNVRGRIVKYTWVLYYSLNPSTGMSSLSSSRTLCTSAKCKAELPLGEHRVRLTVVDNTNDVASNTVRVRVLDGGRPGVRLFFYRGTTKVDVDDKWKSSKTLKPDLSRTPTKLALWTSSKFPNHVLKSDLAVRAVFELDIDRAGWYSLRVDCGSAQCYVLLGHSQFISWFSGTRSRGRNLTVATYPIHIIWRRKASTDNARLVLQWVPPWVDPQTRAKGHVAVPSTELGHRPGDMPPVVHFVTPPKPQLDTLIKVYGSGFVPGTRVFLGTTECRGVKIIGQFLLTCEVAGSTGFRRVTAHNGAYVSNHNIIINVQGRMIIDVPSQPIRFSQGIIQKGKKNWKLSSATSVVLGPDNRYYFGTQWGAIVGAIIEGNRLQSACASKQIDNRSILGLAFNPRDGAELKLYATMCTLFWDAKKKLPKKTGWRNGEVWTFVPRGGSDGCLKPSVKIASGIPVSNYDHGVNKIAFDDYGNMYVSVGSNTNGGVPSKEFGNVKDTVLSGAVLSFPIAKAKFNGHIKYDSDDDISKAKVIGGDVSAFVVGTRNCFGLAYHSSGRLYATDNGGNQAFGPRSTGCNSDTRPRNEDDKVLLLKKGAWYGSANRARGLHGKDPRQCVHKRPGIDKTGYELPLATTEPATTGILEYTANTFGARLRGNLLLSQLATSESAGRLYRARIDPATGSIKSMYTLGRFTGLSMAISPWGDLIMPRVYKQQVAILQAIEDNPKLVAVTSLNPNRGPKRGGHQVFVAGWNFGADAKKIRVDFVGVGVCKNVRFVAKNGRSFWCTVPKLMEKGPKKVPVLVTVDGVGMSTSAGFEYWYMAI